MTNQVIHTAQCNLALDSRCESFIVISFPILNQKKCVLNLVLEHCLDYGACLKICNLYQWQREREREPTLFTYQFVTLISYFNSAHS